MKNIKGYIKDIPRLAKEFDVENNIFPIDNITTGSSKKVKWICEKNHKWTATPFCRAKKQQNCPYCAGNKPIKGENDLATKFPDIARQWNSIKNGDLKPEDFKPQSNIKVWWVCPEGHEYEAVISSRTTRGNGCPYCSGRYAIKGENDLATKLPDITRQWNSIKNGDLKPEDFKPQSNIKVWWVCPEGHEYEMFIRERNRKDKPRGCPYCSGKKPIVGVNDLGTICKESYHFWDYDKNDTTPTDYLPNSWEKVWMKCEKGHSWHQTLLTFVRTRKCPYCSGFYLEKNVNTLKALYPTIADKWDYEKNNIIDIDTVHVGSCGKMYWWKCEKDHSWMKSVNEMVKAIKSKGQGCPYCLGSISKYSI